MNNYRFSHYDLRYTAAVMLLVPSLRLFPTLSARYAGDACWLSALTVLPVLIFYSWFLSLFMHGRGNGEGMAEIIMRMLGKRLGFAALIISALWFTLYCAFLLRAGADRLITTIYTGSSHAFFAVITGIAAFIAVLGAPRNIVRTARMIFPAVFFILILILIIALRGADAEKLLPITSDDIVPVLKGGISAVDVISCVMYAVCFLECDCDREKGRFSEYALWSVFAVLLLSAISAAIVGNFGAALTARLTRPFFSLVRNLVFFNTIERMEAFAAALWILPDFVSAGVFLFSAQHCLRLALGFETDYKGEHFTSLSDGRFYIWLCACAAISTAVLLAPNTEALTQWSERIIPTVNIAYAFLFLPLIYIVGKCMENKKQR